MHSLFDVKGEEKILIFYVVFSLLVEVWLICFFKLSKDPFPIWIRIFIIFLFLVKLFFLSLVEIGLLFIFLKGVGEILLL